MRSTMENVERVTDRIAALALWVAGTGLVLMTVFIAMQVFWRYVLNNSLTWTEPASLLIMGWFIFLGAAVGIREGYHLSFDVVLFFATERMRQVFHSISDALVGAFGAGMVFYGMQLAAQTAQNTMPALGVSGAVVFFPVIFGGALIVLFAIERLLRRATGLRTRRFGDQSEVEE